MQPSPSAPNRIHPGLTGNATQLGMGASVAQVCPLFLPKTIPPFLLRELGHELKTPLTGLLGLAQLFRAEIKPNTQRQSQCANLIYQKAQQLLIAIYDLMDLSQLSCHQFNLNVQSLELSQVIQTAWQSTIAQYDESYLKITPDLQTDVEQVTADAVRLKQLFIHLISHFLLQLPKSSALSIHSFGWGSWFVIQCSTPSYWLPEGQQGLFNQYPQYPGLEDSSTQSFSDVSSIFKLLLVHYLAQLQGGTAFLLSAEQFGTEFTILLPQDITTPQNSANEPLTMVLLSTRIETAQFLQPICKAENVLLIQFRSPVEIQDRLHLLHNLCLVIDRQGAEDGSEIPALLEHDHLPIQRVAVLGESSPESKPSSIVEFWPTNVTSTQVQQTIQRWQLDRLSSATAVSAPPVYSPWESKSQVARVSGLPLTLLQIDAPLPESLPTHDNLFNQLANLHRCSIVTADHVEQAELLFRVWSPHIVVCTTVLSSAEIEHLVESELAVSPIVFLDYDAQTIARLQRTPLRTYFYTSSPEPLTLKQQVEYLYQFLTEIVRP